jgi:filamentous hemagglutinin family protein
MRPQPRRSAFNRSSAAPVDLCVLRLKPLAQSIALLLLAGSAQAAPVFGSAWFAAKGAAPLPAASSAGAVRPGMPPPLAQQQRAQQQLGRSLSNMNHTIAAIAASQAAQTAGRSAALANPQTLHNGLGGNGLNASLGADGKALFTNAEAPQQSEAGGKVAVNIRQTADKAILNWDSFNIGRDTTLTVQQDANWAALNRVSNSTAPSQIQGQIKAAGTLMIVNNNGVVFSGSSQVNVRNLVVAATQFTDEQFRSGLYNTSAASFSQANGAIEVASGAQLTTHAPSASTVGGGYVLLLGKTVDNAGSISTPRGQTLLAAGDSFSIRRGQGSEGNASSTTRGHEVTPSGSGRVSNNGQLLAAAGDVSLLANQVQQNGLALASTTVDARGTLHLNASGSNASVTLAPGSVSAILLEQTSQALDSQRDALLAPTVTGASNVMPGDPYRRDQSLIEIQSSGTVDFAAGSMTLASGGQIAVTAAQRSLVRDGAVIDVSGATGVKVAMESNNLKVNIQGNEQRDAAVNREQAALNNQDVWVDARELVLVPAGTNGYPTDRWYTAGGLLEVSGYLGTQARSVGQWMAQGGTATFSGQQVVTQAGSQINLSGGTLDVQSGVINQTWLRADNGRLYELSSAPGDILYRGVYQGYEDSHPRWGQTAYFYNPLLAPRQRSEGGYTLGRDAGSLVISTTHAVLEGSVVGDTFQGERQVQAARAGLDGYKQTQKAVARGAQLIVGSYLANYLKDSARLLYSLDATPGTVRNIVLSDAIEQIAMGLDLSQALPEQRQGTLYLNTRQLRDFALGSLQLAASTSLQVDAEVQVAAGGHIALYAPQVTVNARLSAAAGTIELGNVRNQITSAGIADTVLPAGEQRATVSVGKGATLDVSGLWSNLRLNAADISAVPYLNGGDIVLRSSNDLLLAAGSLLDVSSGAVLRADGSLQGGQGGNLTLQANAASGVANDGRLQLGSQLRAQGVKGGGSLTLQAGQVLIADTANTTTPAASDSLLLAPDFFQQGFAAYQVIGSRGLEVAQGSTVNVASPVYRLAAAASTSATGAEPEQALQSWTPPLYLQDASKAELSQRQGASLVLQAGNLRTRYEDIASTDLLIGTGAQLTVDPGQSIQLRGPGQITVDGQLNAWGGLIAINNLSINSIIDAQMNQDNGRSIWLGDNARLDVAARAVSALDARGNRYGQVAGGGSIVVGGEIDHATGDVRTSSAFVVVREGAQLDASGSRTVVNINGLGATELASQGGRISLASTSGLYLDGQLSARAGGAGAAGGSLEVALGAILVGITDPLFNDRVRQPRELIVEQQSSGHLLASTAREARGLLEYGHGRLAVAQVERGGFANLALLSSGMLTFAGSLELNLANALQLYAGSYGLAQSAAADSQVNLHGSYVRLAGSRDLAGGLTAATSTAIRGDQKPNSQAVAGQLSLSADNLLDIRDTFSIGMNDSIRMLQGRQEIERRGFSDVLLRSMGDMRLLTSPGNLGARVFLRNRVQLQAAQIYPGIGASLELTATQVDIGRTSTPTALPYSAFGSFRINAGVINQGGIVRAPFGVIGLKTDIDDRYVAMVHLPGQLNLLPGSLTSVSGAGLAIPDGGTVDGYSWLSGEVQQNLTTVANSLGQVILSGRVIDVAPGASIDVSGGGEVLGAGFVSGRGGSTDARFNPLLQYGPEGFVLPDRQTNPVYAIVPGPQPGYAPVVNDRDASEPLLGQQVSIGAGVPGLPAGTYTLMPATYALLPGAFRVELNGLAQLRSAQVPAQRMRNGSWSTSATLSLASGTRDNLPSQVIVTPANTLRRYSQYNETSLSQYLLADAARMGVQPVLLPRDAKALNLVFSSNSSERPSFSFAGNLLKARGEGGRGSTTSLSTLGSMEIISAQQQPTPGFAGVSLRDAAINAMGAESLSIGGQLTSAYGQGGNFLYFGNATPRSDAPTRSLALRSGASLYAPEVFLLTNGIEGGITLEQGASINTLGQGAAPRDSRAGYVYLPGRNSVLAVSNAYLRLLATELPDRNTPQLAPGSILLGGCATTCAGTATLYSEGTIAAATDNRFELSDAVRYGTRNLTLMVGGINVGSSDTLAAYSARNLLSDGLSLNQTVLERLLRGDTSVGAPALETLVLGARDALNFYGNASLDTFAAGASASSLKELVLTTPAIYGLGEAGDSALIRTRNLIWNSADNEAGSVINGGAGSGAGTLRIDAERVELGYEPDNTPRARKEYERLLLGFAEVSINASERVTANHRSSLAVFQRQDGYISGQGQQYSGGNLSISTPLLTGAAASVSQIRAGGDIRISAPAGSKAAAVGAADLGAELSLSGRHLSVDGNLWLPSGKLTLNAEQNLSLGAAAYIDLAGRTVSFNDVLKYSWAGDLVLQSRYGDIRQAVGSRIDLSASFNQGGSLEATALAPGAGTVALLGTIMGASSGGYDAGGTWVPYNAASIDIRAQRLGEDSLSRDFAALNQRLNQGQVFGARSFQLKQGDLLIGDELKAGSINLSLDNGQLSVLGRVDASGQRVGSIRLAAGRGLSIGANAVLDAHGSLLRVDSYGQIIDAPNRAIVELSSGEGQLHLAAGASIDLRHGTGASVGNDGRARGTLQLNAPRVGGATAGDIAIDASGSLNIQGAKLIAVNAMQRYDDAAYGSEPSASGQPYQLINQAYLDAKHADSTLFINHALANVGLLSGKLAGLNNTAYADALHLRPGVEIVSRTATGDLLVQGDVDLSGYRYASLNPGAQQSAVYGSGEVGSLLLRAGGNLDVMGSINDGFAPPPDTPDDTGWLLLPGKQPFNGDVVVPRAGIELQGGTIFLAGVTLNYDLPVQAMSLAAGTRLPVAVSLKQPLELAAGTVLSGDIRSSSGELLYAAGSRLTTSVSVAEGSILGPGSLLLGDTALAGFTWPKGVPLPSRPAGSINVDNPDVLVQAGTIVLPLGALIPAGTDVKLAEGVSQINLRGGDGKGKNWALAPMLAEGSQSWSLRAVAGADLQAADSRLVDPYAAQGHLRLADSHYGMLVTVIPGSASGGRTLTAEGSLAFYGNESKVGTSIAELAENFGATEDDICADASFCSSPPRVLSKEGALAWYGDESKTGTPVAEAALFNEMSEDGICSIAGACVFGSSETTVEYRPGMSRFSVLRTGTGDLDLLSSGDLSMHSLYGLYTAGTSSLGLADSGAFNLPRGATLDKDSRVLESVLAPNAGAYEALVDGGDASLYRAWYPDGGGNLLVSVGGDLTGDLIGRKTAFGGDAQQLDSASVANWLWRQGGGVTRPDMPTAWWINFGSFAPVQEGITNVAFTGFTGLGTLGGGNLTVSVAGDAGLLMARGDMRYYNEASRSQGLVLAVGATGRLVNGQLLSTGGGDLDLRVGGGLNPSYAARQIGDTKFIRPDLYGSLSNLRGAVRVTAGSLGTIALAKGADVLSQDPREVRAYNPFIATMADAGGGLTLLPGDSSFSLNTRGDLVISGAADAARLPARAWQRLSLDDGTQTVGYSWFSLWTDNTAIDLFAAGGNLAPSTQTKQSTPSDGLVAPRTDFNTAPTDGRYVYPSILRAAAPSGSFYLGHSASAGINSKDSVAADYSLLLAPGKQAQLEFLAGDSIYAGGYAVTPTNVPQASLATPFRPGFYYRNAQNAIAWGEPTQAAVSPSYWPLFAFAGTGVSEAYRGAAQPTRFYAVNGDIVGLGTGEILSFSVSTRTGTWYEGARPTWMLAGRDIVNSGQLTARNLNQLDTSPGSTGNVFVHDQVTDVSRVSAGRDILYSSFTVAGPGTLEVTAGRHIQMENRGAITSLGPVVPGDERAGASLVLQAGAGAAGADYLSFAQRYLANGALAGTYQQQLNRWLSERFAFTGSNEQALAYFAALPAEQQRIFARGIYFAELQAAGREYNNPQSPRYGSYARGRNAIEALFPSRDVAGNPIAYGGDITFYGGAGVRSLVGGDIQMLSPGGQQIFGIEGVAPPASAGVITQGQGDIQLFANGNVLLGQSRIMTTFGGDILVWSAQGDINAGRGSKTTQIYTPPRRVYDLWGNVSLSPTVPSTGAGIATLNPIAEIAPGDIDLIAPLGTIDAGEAGIRVSGNVNIAALQVVNAANIQVQGDSQGVPLAAVVNTGALSSASSAASSASTAAESVARDQQAAARQRMPSVFSVQVLGFGSERPATSEGASRSNPGYDAQSSVQVLGAGPLNEQALQRLSAEERNSLSL